jgi:Mn2+/Fe2+ NRAMP family transporter
MSTSSNELTPHHPRRSRLWGSGYFRRIGPGLVTGAADDDPSGIGTYSQVGAASGNQLLWSAPTLLPFAFAVQEACARLALVTGKGLAALIRANLPRPVLYLAVAAVALANSFNIAADLGSMSAALGLLIPIPQALGVLLFAVGIAITEVLVPYHRYARFLKWLCFSLIAYIGVLAVAHVNWSEVLHSTFVPHMSFTKATLIALIALAGTTISPYLFFWQAAEEMEDESGEVPDVSLRHLQAMRGDVLAGIASAVFIMFAIMATSAATLHVNGITEITSAEQAASALEPLAGRFASVLFLLGIVGTGLLAVPVLAGSTAYALSEAFGWQEGLERRPGQARAFYAVIIGSMLVALVLNYVGINPMHFLYLAAILNGLTAPILMFLVWLLARDSELMGEWRSKPWSQILLLGATLLMISLPIMWLFAG